jgi:hypothetical protein
MFRDLLKDFSLDNNKTHINFFAVSILSFPEAKNGKIRTKRTKIRATQGNM